VSPKQRSLPSGYRQGGSSLDGKSFLTTAFHQAPHHYIQVVSTWFEQKSIRSYQITHQHRIGTVSRQSIPQAKFSYALSPVEVHVGQGEKKWYEFLTSVLAIVGGAFTVMGLLQGTAQNVKKIVKGGKAL